MRSSRRGAASAAVVDGTVDGAAVRLAPIGVGGGRADGVTVGRAPIGVGGGSVEGAAVGRPPIGKVCNTMLLGRAGLGFTFALARKTTGTLGRGDGESLGTSGAVWVEMEGVAAFSLGREPRCCPSSGLEGNGRA